jgi:hypothetical protein
MTDITTRFLDAEAGHVAAETRAAPAAVGQIARTECISTTPVRHVALAVDPAGLRDVHREIAARLSRLGIYVSLLFGRGHAPLPPSVDLLLTLERMIHRPDGPRLGRATDAAALGLPAPSAQEPPDVVLDFTGDATSARGAAWRVLYDGFPGEAVLFGALLAGRMPVVEIEDTQTGTILSRGVPCADNAGTVGGAFECVLARVVDLILVTVAGWGTLSPRPVAVARTAAMRNAIAFEARTLAHAAIRKLYHLCCHAPHWRTCWRFVDGPDLWGVGSLAGITWNVIPDPGFRFYADPFPFVHEGRTYVFVEDLDHRTNRACISVVPFDENGPCGAAEPVLEEPWHLSYPFVFAHEGQVWMIPESSANRSIGLYRAEKFPHRWVREATLIGDIEASDATIVQHGGSLWMFAATRSGAGSWSDTLSLYSAPKLLGPWTPHPGNPVLIDQASARAAGAVVRRGGKLWRPVQDCTGGYGTGIGLAEILRLDHEGYEQKVHSVLRAGADWPGRRFHTLNRAGRLECIDGAAHSPRSRWLARRLENWSGRRELPAGWPSGGPG